MKKILYVATLIISMATFKIRGECEDCKKLRKEIKESWDATIMISREIRSLMEHNLKNLETIRKYQN